MQACLLVVFPLFALFKDVACFGLEASLAHQEWGVKAIFKCRHKSKTIKKMIIKEDAAVIQNWISQVKEVVMEVPLPVRHSARCRFISPRSGRMWAIAVWVISGAGRLTQNSTAPIVAPLLHPSHMPTAVTTNTSNGVWKLPIAVIKSQEILSFGLTCTQYGQLITFP